MAVGRFCFSNEVYLKYIKVQIELQSRKKFLNRIHALTYTMNPFVENEAKTEGERKRTTAWRLIREREREIIKCCLEKVMPVPVL